MEFAFKVGDRVEARQQFGDWEPAIVSRLEPYLGRPGYYVYYPGATEMWHCHGGWKPESCLRNFNQNEQAGNQPGPCG